MTKKNKGIPAGAFWASFSAAGRIDIAAPRPCAHCKSKQARWDSIYCSEACKQAFHAELRGEKTNA